MRHWLFRPANRLAILLIVVGAFGVGWAADGLGWFGRTPTAIAWPNAGVALQAARSDAAITGVIDRLRHRPDDPALLRQLGDAYLVKARETADPTFYSRAELALTRANDLRPDDPQTLAALGELALARHDFTTALAFGARAQLLAPNAAYPWAVISDALMELGRYPEAVGAVQQMVNRRPDINSLARVSYVREMHGDLPGAIAAMREAADSGAPFSESRAWATYQLGMLYFTVGDLDMAAEAFAEANTHLPGYPFARVGMARVVAARGDYAQAAALAQDAVNRTPLPEFVTLLADIARAAGRHDDAIQHERLVTALSRVFAANGMNTDLELALFDLNRGENLPEALAMLQRVYHERPSIPVTIALAWAYSQNGDHVAALPLVRDANRLGTQDPLLLYYSGTIARRAGEVAEAQGYFARALALNPRFSLRFADDLETAARALTTEVRP